MTDREATSRRAQAFFEDLWKRGDPWELESSAFEQAKYARYLAMLDDRRYARALEVGCGAGYFTRKLVRISEHVVALDIAPTAVARARAIGHQGGIDFRVANIMDWSPSAEGPWDLVILNETIYYLGWLYSFFDVAWLASQLFSATEQRGRLLMANTQGWVEDLLIRPWVIRTYRDLFLNVGYELETEEVYVGTKNGVELEVLISLFVRVTGRVPTGSSPAPHRERQ